MARSRYRIDVAASTGRQGAVIENGRSIDACAPLPVTEVVPPKVRASGFSLAYSLATAVGGFTPFIVTWLIARTGNLAIPGLWLTAAAAISLAAVLFAHRDPERAPPRVARDVPLAK